jgi:hypothetical protein
VNPTPCEEHNTWTDFDSGGTCSRCGWSEKALEVRALQELLDNPVKYVGIEDRQALQRLWKRELGGTDGQLVQPVTEEDLAQFLKAR